MEKLKGVFLTAIGEPAPHDQIKKHKERQKRLDELQGDLNVLNAILDTLKMKYNRQKYQLFFIRCWLMKSMIKSTLERAQQVFDGKRDQPSEPEVRGQLVEYVENMKKLNELKKAYHIERTAADVIEELHTMKAEIQQLDGEFKQKRRLIEQLRKDYQTSKSMLYFERYKEMKSMIKKTFRATARATGN